MTTRLLALTGRKQLPMLKVMLLSLLCTWRRAPELVVISDGTLDVRKTLRVLDFYPSSPRILTREVVVARARSSGGETLAAFAAVSLFGLKFAAAVMEARSGPVLLADADILWFRDFAPELDRLNADHAPVVLQTMRDYQKSYDPELEALFPSFGVEPSEPYVNAGLVYLKGDLLSALDLNHALGVAARRERYFGEQTLWALASAAMRVEPWRSDLVACAGSDHLALGVTYRGMKWYARHYVGPVRHLFWRDALAQRMGISP